MDFLKTIIEGGWPLFLFIFVAAVDWLVQRWHKQRNVSRRMRELSIRTLVFFTWPWESTPTKLTNSPRVRGRLERRFARELRRIKS